MSSSVYLMIMAIGLIVAGIVSENLWFVVAGVIACLGVSYLKLNL